MHTSSHGAGIGTFEFDKTAQWIWLPDSPRPYNTFACFRRTFELPTAPESARLRITADSRYEVYLNGTFLGHGPVRAWPHLWSVDDYDLTHLIRAGRNTVAVVVQHFGLSTFQYLHAEPGLLAQVEVSGREPIATGASWRCHDHPGYAWPVPRISCQQAWEEQLDARVVPGLVDKWTATDFDDSVWQRVRATRVAGQPPHERFELRDIPQLTRQAVEPVRLRAVDVVEPCDHTFTLNPRDYLNADDKSANHVRGRMIVVTHVHAGVEQEIQVQNPHHRPRVEWKLNGQVLAFDDKTLQKTDTGVAHARLKKGVNVLMARLPEIEHYGWCTVNLWTESPVVFSARPDGSSARTPWLAFGPFEGPKREHSFDTVLVDAAHVDPVATEARYSETWDRGRLTDDDIAEPFCRELSPDMVCAEDVFAQSASDRPLTGAVLKIDEPEALLTDSSDWTTVHPPEVETGSLQPATPSPRLLLDFGKEVIGFHEFEVDAPAGTILDFHNFEFIQRDGRFNLNEGMNNSFRYTCRDGIQHYRTFVRRGFRYSWLTIRHMTGPVRIRYVRMLMSTYPAPQRGEFACSDDRLEEIWQVGLHSVRCCSEDTYTDCPTYEQTLWVGDARNEAMVDLVANGDPRLSARCLVLSGRSLFRSPIVESQVPSGWQNILPAWSFLWMRWCEEHYQLTGDRAFAGQILDHVAKNVEGMRGAINGQGLFAMVAWNLFDWAPMDTPGRGIVTHVNCQAVHALRQCAGLAAAVDQKDRADDWKRFADALAEAVNTHLWSEKKQAYVDCIRADGTLSPVFSQQTQTAAYISGVATGERADRCRDIVHKAPKGFVEAGSPFFMFFLLEALVREADWDGLIDTIRTYWGKQIEAGATTFWEMYHEGAPRLTRSHCHGWSAAPVVFLTQYVLGVRPGEAGYKTVRVAPHPGKLAWCQGRVPTPHGVVACSWKNGADAFELEIETPGGVPAEVELPVVGSVLVVSGTAMVAPDGAVRTTGGAVRLRVERAAKKRGGTRAAAAKIYPQGHES
jgi:hypothetical protein